MAKIIPTVGRVVWYYPANRKPGDQPQAAIISYVHSEAMLNLGVFEPRGEVFGRRSVRLVQAGEEVPQGEYATWMPYQIGQAARTEAAEKALHAM